MSLYGCYAVELISPECPLPNGNSHIRSINALVGGRRRQSHLSFARFSKERSMGLVYQPLSELELSVEP